MTDTRTWQGDIRRTSAKVGVLTTTEGVLSAVVDGREYTGDTIDIATTGGWGAVSITGLDAGMTYIARLYVDGVHIGNQQIWTMKDSGDINVLWMFCSGPPHRDVSISETLRRLRNEGIVPDLCIWLGDWIYHSNVGPAFGIQRKYQGGSYVPNGLENDYATAIDLEAALIDSTLWFNKPDQQELMRTCPIWFFPDDHELLDNYQDDVTAMSDPGRSSPLDWVTGAKEYYDAWDVQIQAVDAVQCANPDKDETRLTVVDWGPLRIIVPFEIEKTKSLDSGSHFMTTEQMDNLLAALSGGGSAVVFRPIFSSKSVVSNNGDGWYDQCDSPYDGTDGDLFTVLDHIEDNEISTVAWPCGDLHRQFALYKSNPRGLSEQTAYSPLLCMGPGSTSQTQVSLTQTDGIIMNRPGFGVGLMRIPADHSRVEWRMYDEMDGLFFTRYQLPGSNRAYCPRPGGGMEEMPREADASGDPSLILEVPTITDADDYSIAVSSLPGGDFPLDYGSFEGTLAVSGTFLNTTGRVIFSVTNSINNGLQIKTTTNAEQIGYILRNFDNNPSAQDYSGAGTETGYGGDDVYTLRASWDKDNGYFACLKNETTGVILDASDLTGSGNGFASGTDLYVLGANWAGGANETATLTDGKFYNEAKGQAWCQEIIA